MFHLVKTVIIKVIALLLLCLLYLPSNLFAQSKERNPLVLEARRSWGNMELQKSFQLYSKAVEMDESSFNATFELALFEINVHNDYTAGLKHLEKARELMSTDTVYEVYQYLGDAYQYHQKYDQAITSYTTFLEGVKSEDLRETIETKIQQCSFALKYDYQLWDGKFINFGNKVNSDQSEYCTVLPMKDSFMLYTKRNAQSAEDAVSIIPLEEIYFSKQKNGSYHPGDEASQLSDFEELSDTEKGHNSVVSTSITGDTLLIYKENKLWISYFQSGIWQQPELLPRNINIGKNQRHACFSPDGKRLFFSSNRKKGHGGYDLYVSEWDSTQNWSEPKNLGLQINSSGNEDSPFITKEGTRMYFASSGHLGYGGYDIFYSDWQDTAWSAPVNAGIPFNTPADDIFFSVVANDDSTAFLSSSRLGGEGKMDVYYFYKYGQPKFLDCQTNLAQSVPPVDTSYYQPFVQILGKDTLFMDSSYVFQSELFNTSGLRTTNVFWKLDTAFMAESQINLNYDTVGNHRVQMEVLLRDSLNEELRFCVSREFVVVAPPIPIVKKRTFKDTNEIALSIGSKLKEESMNPLPEGFSENLASIYFDFNKYSVRKDQRAIMDANIAIIKNNPKMVIKIIGHTDKVGTKEYNAKLSQKRATAAVKYLTERGVSIHQIVAVLSYGEDEAGERFKNEDGSDDLEKMESSRRVDLYIIGLVE